MPEEGGEEQVKRRPGGEMPVMSLEINGVFYDPAHPPKLTPTADGKHEYRGGKTIDRDDAYSIRFWAKDQPKGLRDAMRDSLETAITNGEFSSIITATKGTDGKVELDQASKEKLSAYRVMAREMGYTIGSYQYREKASTVIAPITKAPPQK